MVWDFEGLIATFMIPCCLCSLLLLDFLSAAVGAFRPLSIEQYHWLEYQQQASLWRHTPAAQQQCQSGAGPPPPSATGSPHSRLAAARRQRAEQAARPEGATEG